jgi:hypothetical protein
MKFIKMMEKIEMIKLTEWKEWVGRKQWSVEWKEKEWKVVGFKWKRAKGRVKGDKGQSEWFGIKQIKPVKVSSFRFGTTTKTFRSDSIGSANKYLLHSDLVGHTRCVRSLNCNQTWPSFDFVRLKFAEYERCCSSKRFRLCFLYQ